MDFTKEQLSELICKHTEKESKHPNLTDFYMAFVIANFAVKKRHV